MLSTPAAIPSPCSILVVDDNPEITELLCEYLNGIGATASAVNDGQSAIARLRFHRIDALILNLVMPGVTGWDILQFVVKSASNLHSRTIVLTGDRYRLWRSPR